MANNKYTEDAIYGTEKALRALKLRIAETMVYTGNLSTSAVISNEVLTDYINSIVDLLGKSMVQVSNLETRVSQLSTES